MQVFRPVPAEAFALGANPFGDLRAVDQRLGESSRDDDVRDALGLLGARRNAVIAVARMPTTATLSTLNASSTATKSW